MKELRDRVAVVTGGGSGIGKAIALAAGAEGMRVVVADIEADAAEDVARELRSQGGRVLAAAVDVSQRASVEALATRTYDELGACHLLCNNAGVFLTGALVEQRRADWEWILGVNLHGVIHGIEAFVPRMIAQSQEGHVEEGHIVNTASLSGLVAMPGFGVYTTSKYALVGLSETLRLELAPHGIGVSVLCPGGVATQIFRSDRNRPAALAESGAAPTDPKAMTQAVSEAGEAFIEPARVADAVLAGVRDNDAFILTHPQHRAAVEQRCQSLMAAFEKAAARA